MARADRTGKRIPRSAFKNRIPDLGRYFIYTDADETEEKYMYGLRDSLPKEFQGRIVIKVSKTILKIIHHTKIIKIVLKI